jgi:ankyrin repeat protein
MTKLLNTLTILFINLLLFGCDKSKLDHDDCKLIEAAHTGDVQLLKDELLRGCDPMGNSDHVNEPIYNAIVFGHVEICKALVEAGVDPNFDWGKEGGNLLTNAAQFGQLDIVKLLLDHGVDVNKEIGSSALFISIVHKHKEIESILVSHGAKLNESDLRSFEEYPFLDTR